MIILFVDEAGFFRRLLNVPWQGLVPGGTSSGNQVRSNDSEKQFLREGGGGEVDRDVPLWGEYFKWGDR